MLTLTLIFYGLIGLVPSINGEGAMVVFPSAENLVDPRDYIIPKHSAQAFRVLYSDDETPYRLVPVVFPGGPPSYIEVEYSPSTGLSRAGGLRTAANGSELVFPSNSDQVFDLSWIPELARLSSPSADIRSECLVHPNECKISLLVRTWQADAHVCHLAHPNRDVEQRKETCGIPGRVLAYRIKDLEEKHTSGDILQAVSDAFVLQLTFDRIPEAVLRLVSPNGKENRLSIPFGAETNITLLFANLPEPRETPQNHCHDRGVDHHFYAYYDLGNTDPRHLTSWPLPQSTNEEAPGDIKMSCEGEITLLERWLIADYRKLLNDDTVCIDQKPHSIEVCSTAQFFSAVLPSLRSKPPEGTDTQAPALAAEGGAAIGPIRRRPVPTIIPTGIAARPSRRAVAPVTTTPAAPSARISPPG